MVRPVIRICRSRMDTRLVVGIHSSSSRDSRAGTRSSSGLRVRRRLLRLREGWLDGLRCLFDVCEGGLDTLGCTGVFFFFFNGNHGVFFFFSVGGKGFAYSVLHFLSFLPANFFKKKRGRVNLFPGAENWEGGELRGGHWTSRAGSWLWAWLGSGLGVWKCGVFCLTSVMRLLLFSSFFLFRGRGITLLGASERGKGVL